MAWLRDRRDLKILRSTAPIAEDESVANNCVGAKAHRPRTRSDSKWLKITRKKAVEKENKAFEWPPMRWRKSKNQQKSVSRSQSVAGLTNHEVDKVVESKLKRHGSERSKKSVAFENSSGSWWNSSMKLLFDMTSGKSGKNKTRRRHLSSDARNSFKNKIFLRPFYDCSSYS